MDYRIRVTRVPLQPVEREQMRAAGTLYEDYRSRELPVHDYVSVQAPADAPDDDLTQLAMAKTHLCELRPGEHLYFELETTGEKGLDRRPLDAPRPANV